MCNEMSLQDRYEFLAELNEKKKYTELTGAFLKLFLDTNFKYVPENFDMLLSEDASMEEKEAIANNMLNAFKDALQKNEVTGLTVADNLLASDAELNFLLGLINADSEIDDIMRDIAYEALTGLINAKNMSNTK